MLKLLCNITKRGKDMLKWQKKIDDKAIIKFVCEDMEKRGKKHIKNNPTAKFFIDRERDEIIFQMYVAFKGVNGLYQVKYTFKENECVCSDWRVYPNGVKNYQTDVTKRWLPFIKKELDKGTER